MKKSLLLVLSLVLAAALSGAASAADAADAVVVEDAYAAYERIAGPLQDELFAKRAELDAMDRGGNRDDAKAQQLFREIAELNGKLFAAETELRSKLEAAAPSAPGYGRHHYGEFSGQAYRGGSMHHGGGHGGYARHGGWDW